MEFQELSAEEEEEALTWADAGSVKGPGRTARGL